MRGYTRKVGLRKPRRYPKWPEPGPIGGDLLNRMESVVFAAYAYCDCDVDETSLSGWHVCPKHYRDRFCTRCTCAICVCGAQ